MRNFTFWKTKKKEGTYKTFKQGLLLSLFFVSSLLSNAQHATNIYTDFGGFWHSSLTVFNPILPNNSHNVIAFTFGGTTYSTGVNNNLLTTKGVSFTPGSYKTLPFTSISGTIPSNNNDIYIALSSNYDGVASGFSTPLPSIKAKVALTDGINGLNIGTGITNLPSSAGMIFPAQIISNSSIDDNQPDIIYAQLTDAATSADVLVFQDNVGHTVGKSNSIQWNLVKTLGKYSADLYNLRTGAKIDTASITGGVSSNTEQSMRLATFRLADFGITAANASQVKSLVIKPAGSSDPAFIAYNTDALYIIPPIINAQPENKVVCTGSGGSATFSVVAEGLLLTYQWLKNGTNIPGATQSSYTVSSVSAGDVGSYQVVVTNPGGVQYSDVAYLNTTIVTQPGPASQTIVTGNSVTYLVSATNTTSFQWKKNGVDILGATDSIYTINPLTSNDGGSYTVSAVNSGGNGCATVPSNAVSLTPVIVVYSKGAGDINVPATWGANIDGSGSTPVDFTRGEHTFVLSNRPAASTLTNLTIAGTLDVKDGVATITDNTTLDVGRAIRTGAGSISGSYSAALTVRGNSNLYFTTGNQVLKDFTITGGTVTTLSPLTISGGAVLPGKLNLNGGTLALSGNKITIQSTSLTNTSMVTTVASGANITYGTGGAFIVERFIPAKRAFRLLSPGVTTTTSIKRNWMEGVHNTDRWNNINPLPGYGTHITGSPNPHDSVDATQTLNPSLYTWDQVNQKWIAIANSSSTLTAGKPYRLMVRGSRSVDLNDNEAVPSNTVLRITGTLTTGTVNVSSDMLSSKTGSYSFVGNPYASPINWDTITKTSIANTYYQWDPTLNRRGSFVTYNGWVKTNSNPSSNIDNNIQSGQAFFVQTNASNPSLQFKESDKTVSNTRVFRGAGDMTKISVQLMLNMDAGNENAADGLVAVFQDGFFKTIGDEDSYKFGNLDENIAINRNGTDLSIEGRPSITVNDTIPLKVWQFRQKDYWLKLEAKNFPPAVNGVVKDEFLKKETPVNLSSSTYIPFNITNDPKSSATNRFSILFETYVTLPVVITSLKAYMKEKGIQVEWNIATETNVKFYEVEKSADGQQFEKACSIPSKGNSTVAQIYNWYDATPNTGANFYRIKITDKNGTVTYSSIVSVNIKNATTFVSVFPNPVKGKNMGLQINNLEKGLYTIRLYNNLGQGVFVSSIDHKGGSASQTILLNSKLSAGKYNLQLTNKETTINKAVIFQ